MRKTRFYLAGAMSGLPDLQFPRFHRVSARLRTMGHEVTNPAEVDEGDTSGEWAYYLRRDLQLLLDCEAVAVLSGWEDSRGASLEVHVARELGMPVYDADTLEPLSETILEEAQRLIHGDRQSAYGHPSENLGHTAGLWTAYLSRTLSVPLTAPDVAWMMVLLKASRDTHSPKRDNLTDAAGYVGTIEMMR